MIDIVFDDYFIDIDGGEKCQGEQSTPRRVFQEIKHAFISADFDVHQAQAKRGDQ